MLEQSTDEEHWIITVLLFPFRLIYRFFVFLFGGSKSQAEQIDELAEQWVNEQMADEEEAKYCDPTNFFHKVVVELKDFLYITRQDGRNYTISELRRMIIRAHPDIKSDSDLDCLLKGTRISNSAVQVVADLLGISFYIFEKGTSEATHIDTRITPSSPGEHSDKWIMLTKNIEEGKERYSFYIAGLHRRIYDASELLKREQCPKMMFLKNCASMSQEEYEAEARRLFPGASPISTRPKLRL